MLPADPANLLACSHVLDTSSLLVEVGTVLWEGWERCLVMDCLQQGLRQLARAMIAKLVAFGPATHSALFIFI